LRSRSLETYFSHFSSSSIWLQEEVEVKRNNIIEKCKRKQSDILLVIMLRAFLKLAIVQKKIVFISPSLHQFCLDFYLQMASTFLITIYCFKISLLKWDFSVVVNCRNSPSTLSPLFGFASPRVYCPNFQISSNSKSEIS
jgi:hypothetical protein